MIKRLRYLLGVTLLLPLAVWAATPPMLSLRCPAPAEYQVTVQHETYGDFIQWKANVYNILYTNDNAKALIPLALTSVRLMGQAVNCVYQATSTNKISQIKTMTVSTSNFGDTGLPAHFFTKNTMTCPYGSGGVCCDPTEPSTQGCGFYFGD